MFSPPPPAPPAWNPSFPEPFPRPHRPENPPIGHRRADPVLKSSDVIWTSQNSPSFRVPPGSTPSPSGYGLRQASSPFGVDYSLLQHPPLDDHQDNHWAEPGIEEPVGSPPGAAYSPYYLPPKPNPTRSFEPPVLNRADRAPTHPFDHPSAFRPPPFAHPPLRESSAPFDPFAFPIQSGPRSLSPAPIYNPTLEQASSRQAPIGTRPGRSLNGAFGQRTSL